MAVYQGSFCLCTWGVFPSETSRNRTNRHDTYEKWYIVLQTMHSFGWQFATLYHSLCGWTDSSKLDFSVISAWGSRSSSYYFRWSFILSTFPVHIMFQPDQSLMFIYIRTRCMQLTWEDSDGVSNTVDVKTRLGQTWHPISQGQLLA